MDKFFLLFNRFKKDNIMPIISGSFPAYFYLYKGDVSKIPKDVDIDIYCVAPNHDSALSLYNDLSNAENDLTGLAQRAVQIMKPEETELYTTWAEHPYFIVSQFDISVARMWMEDINVVRWIKGEDPISDIENKRIRIMRIVNPVKEIYRIIKYASRGWAVDRGDILRIFLEWDNMLKWKKIQCINQVGVGQYNNVLKVSENMMENE